MADLKDMLSSLKPYILRWISGTAGSLGWVEVSWLNPAYASATTITLDGDQTGIFKPGLRVRFKQTTFKYGTLSINSTYDAGTVKTTLTLIANADYSVANAAISEMQISFSTPPDWPGWFNWTPNVGGFSSDPASAVYRFDVVGRRVNWVVAQYSDGTSDETILEVSLPVVAATLFGAGTSIWGGANNIAKDNGSNLTAASRWSISTGATVIQFFKDMSGGTWTASGAKRVRAEGFYEF